jgi:hypothetical protein
VNNWHRRMWTLDRIDPRKFHAELYDKNRTNQFWLEPSANGANTLQFRVAFDDNAMASLWSGVTLAPQGDKPFSNTGSNQNAERLEGTIRIDGVSLRLLIYINKTKKGEELFLKVGLKGKLSTAKGEGTGIATAQN